MIVGYGPEFVLTFTRRTIREAQLYRWTATVSAYKDGPILYQTPQPQPFDPSEPIVILVEPVG